VTFDPERDTPDVLAAQATKLKADPAIWTFLTGDAPTVERFAGKFGVSVMRDSSDPSQIVHNLRTAVVGADGRIAKVYSGNDWTPGDVITELRGLVGGKR
jgi:protein SCO1/2